MKGSSQEVVNEWRYIKHIRVHCYS